MKTTTEMKSVLISTRGLFVKAGKLSNATIENRVLCDTYMDAEIQLRKVAHLLEDILYTSIGEYKYREELQQNATDLLDSVKDMLHDTEFKEDLKTFGYSKDERVKEFRTEFNRLYCSIASLDLGFVNTEYVPTDLDLLIHQLVK